MGSKTLHLFVDANVYLSFYDFTNEDLEELRKMIVLIKEGKVILYLPTHVIEEVKRNRLKRISQALKRVKEERKNYNLPHFFRTYSDFKEFVEYQKKLSKIFDKLLGKILQDIKNENLLADEIIKELFKRAKKIDYKDKAYKTIFEKALLREKMGNPPRNFGDCLIWEILIHEMPNREPLYFITEDKDFLSPLDNGEFNPFLSEEWEEEKKERIIFYNKLSLFFQDHFPHIKLAYELEKELLIDKLRSSPSFRDTHEIVSKLNKFSQFSPTQKDNIISAALNNNQIFWILSDPDIKEFLQNLIKDPEGIDKEKIKELQRYWRESEEDNEDEVPF